MAYHSPSFVFSFPAAADLSTKQWYWVKLNTAGRVDVCTAVTDKPIGVLMNKPAALGRAAEVMLWGISEIIADTTIAIGDELATSADSQGAVFNTLNATAGIYSMGVALQPGVAGDYVSALIWPARGVNSSNQDISLVAAASYTANQYHLVGINTSGQAVLSVDADGALPPIGVLQNAPASGAAATVRVAGKTLVVAATGNVVMGDKITCHTDGTGIGTTTAEDYVLGIALTSAVAGATFTMQFYTASVPT